MSEQYPLSEQYALLLIVMGVWLILLGVYIVSQNPIYSNSTGGPLVTIGYNETGYWFFSTPGLILVIVAVWQAYKKKEK